MNMVENIRRIGIFMIAAQTVLHFAAGKQYEKYLKIITGVIILFQFLSPFTSSADDFAAKWQSEIEQMEMQIEKQMESQTKKQNDVLMAVSGTADTVEAAILQQLEGEVKRRLSDVAAENGCAVTDVVIDLEQVNKEHSAKAGEGNRSWVFRNVKVTVQGAEQNDYAETHDDRTIRIAEIIVGHETEADTRQSEGQDPEYAAKSREYRHLFAQTLGMEDEKVEVIYRGER